MSWAHLGEVFDIHGGGIDLVFPHHENELAQSTCAFGHSVMANVWMHNGFLQVEGEKMSKSLGNFITINQLLATEDFGCRAWNGQVLRLAMLGTHYRSPIDWTIRKLEEVNTSLDNFMHAISDVAPSKPSPALFEALADDLNTPKAIAELFRQYRELDLAGLRAGLELMGFDVAAWTAAKAVDPALEAEIVGLIEERLAARQAKNWAESDRLRDQLTGLGVAIKDNKDGTTSWEMKR
jgi:cysteinyl-tRNA synthetase